MSTRYGLVLGGAFAMAGCAVPPVLPELSLESPTAIVVDAVPGLAPRPLAVSWAALIENQQIESVGLVCGGVIFESDDLYDSDRYQIWQVSSVIERRDRNEIESMYRLPARDLPPRLFEVNRTQ